MVEASSNVARRGHIPSLVGTTRARRDNAPVGIVDTAVAVIVVAIDNTGRSYEPRDDGVVCARRSIYKKDSPR